MRAVVLVHAQLRPTCACHNFRTRSTNTVLSHAHTLTNENPKTTPMPPPSYGPCPVCRRRLFKYAAVFCVCASGTSSGGRVLAADAAMSCCFLFYLRLQPQAVKVAVREDVELVGGPHPYGAGGTCDDKQGVPPKAAPPQQLHMHVPYTQMSFER